MDETLEKMMMMMTTMQRLESMGERVLGVGATYLCSRASVAEGVFFIRVNVCWRILILRYASKIPTPAKFCWRTPENTYTPIRSRGNKGPRNR